MEINSKNYTKYFAFNNFVSLTEKERRDLIKYTVEQIRQEKGLKKVDVEFRDMNPGSRGSCSQKYGLFNHFDGHEMVLNSDILTTKSAIAPYSVYNTINHELEHANQYENAANRSIENSDAATLEQRLNDEHYYSSSGDRIVKTQEGSFRTIRFDSETDFQLYRAQACEADARDAGLKAVEKLRENNISLGVSDACVEDYLDYAQANEIMENREMMKCLGMHSREHMVREELSHISTDRVSEEDREKVIAYARNKDYETAKAVMNEDFGDSLSEEQVKQHFDNNDNYSDFYQSDRYKELKVQDAERRDYKFSKYKWNEQETAGNEQYSQGRDLYRKTVNTGQSGVSDKEKIERFRNESQKNEENSVRSEQRLAFSKTMEETAESSEHETYQVKGASIKVDR